GFTCRACSLSPPVQEPLALSWSPGGKASLQWETVAGATFYNVYRGGPADLPSLLTPATDSCRRTVTTATVTGNVLGETPPTDSFYWYLVRAANGAGEGPAGNASAGPRLQDVTGDCP